MYDNRKIPKNTEKYRKIPKITNHTNKTENTKNQRKTSKPKKHTKENTMYKALVYFTFFVKIVFLGMAAALIYETKIKKEASTSPTVTQITFWKNRTEFVFLLLVVIILLINFYPRRLGNGGGGGYVIVDFETSILIFVYAILTLIQNKWEYLITIKNTKAVEDIQHLFGGFTQENAKDTSHNFF